MEKSFEKNIVPEQREGKAINVTSTIQLSSGQKAKAFFEEVKRRLQDVNNWHTLAGGLSANFRLISNDGKTEQRIPKEGHYLISGGLRQVFPSVQTLHRLFPDHLCHRQLKQLDDNFIEKIFIKPTNSFSFLKESN